LPRASAAQAVLRRLLRGTGVGGDAGRGGMG